MRARRNARASGGFNRQDAKAAELLKPLGYATAQFGNNHFGDLNRFLPTVHGFDEFFGNLYHLNAEEDPEDPDYPDPTEFPKFKASFGPRGVAHCSATTTDDATEQAFPPRQRAASFTIDQAMERLERSLAGR